jgi:hypothetical protein
MAVLDLVQIAHVVVGDVDRVVGQIVFSLDAQIEHEGGAGEFFLREPAVGPAPAQMVWDEPLHGAGEVGH